MTIQNETAPAARTPAERAEDIFRRYPAISAEEANEALTFLRKGRHIDVGLVTGNSELRDNIAAFRAEHSGALTLRLADYVKFILIFALLIGASILLLAR
jgi:hypothetical protein